MQVRQGSAPGRIMQLPRREDGPGHPDIVEDDSIDTVVEVMGGLHPCLRLCPRRH